MQKLYNCSITSDHEPLRKNMSKGIVANSDTEAKIEAIKIFYEDSKNLLVVLNDHNGRIFEIGIS